MNDPTCTAADGKTIVYSIPGYPLMVRAVDFNTLFGAAHHAAPGAPQQPLPLEFIDDHIGADEGDREAVIALVREVEAAHGITARTAERKPADFPTIRVRRASEEALMRQADDDGRFLNAQGHQQAIDAIDFCLAEFSRAAATPPTGTSQGEGTP